LRAWRWAPLRERIPGLARLLARWASRRGVPRIAPRAFWTMRCRRYDRHAGRRARAGAAGRLFLNHLDPEVAAAALALLQAAATAHLLRPPAGAAALCRRSASAGLIDMA
jgi:hypothetical protein